MEINLSDQQPLADREDRKRVELLLDRYPEISLEEEALIIRFLKRGSALEVGLVTSNDAIRAELDRFREDHADQFRIGRAGIVAAVSIILGICALVWLLWDAGISH